MNFDTIADDIRSPAPSWPPMRECVPGQDPYPTLSRAELMAGGGLSVVQSLREAGLYYYLTGSALFNGRGRDLDIVVRIPDDKDHSIIEDLLPGVVVSAGGRYASSVASDGRQCFRIGDVNIIAQKGAIRYANWVTAGGACLAVAMHSPAGIDKKTRCLLHRLIVDGWELPAAIEDTAHL